METKGKSINNIWRKNGTNTEINNIRINISEKYKTFLWLWDKTGTSHAKEILSNFNFSFYEVSTKPKKLISDSITQFHYCSLFEGHENYKYLVTARNPYTRFFSLFRMSSPQNKITIDNFRTFIEEKIQSPNNFNCADFSERTPDFFLRLENLYDDYCKIPFINESNLKRNGTLMILCDNIVNKGKEGFDWKNFYNQSIADLVFYSIQKYFDLLGYDKNSWKK